MASTDKYLDAVIYVYEYEHHVILFTPLDSLAPNAWIWNKKTFKHNYPKFFDDFHQISIAEIRAQIALGTMEDRLSFTAAAAAAEQYPPEKDYALLFAWVRN